MSSNKQLIAFFIELETALQSAYPQSVDLFPVIRSFVYFANRKEEPLQGLAAGTSHLQLCLQAISLMFTLAYLPVALLFPKKMSTLFVAPAQHRNIRSGDTVVSKHLDSLHKRYTQGVDAIWEVGVGASTSPFREPLAMRISRLATLCARLLPEPGNVRRLRPEVEGAIQKHFPDGVIGVDALMLALSSYESSVRFYRAVFSRSGLRRAFFIVYYSRRHLPMIGALNSLGIQTLEYQHGIQNNLHPMYTHWEHLRRRPASMPGQMLLWNDVSLNRIQRWGGGVGLAAEVIGNLWYSQQRINSEKGNGVMVALQHYPRYFCNAIVDVIDNTPQISWVFREHPIYRLSEQEKEQLKRGRSNVSFVGSADEPLEDTLARCFCCVTGFSTVGLEALMCGRVTIFTHENAREGLAEYIDGKTCFYADSAPQIEAILALRQDALAREPNTAEESDIGAPGE